MSTAAAVPAAAAPAKGKKKLLIIIIAVVLLVVVGGVGALVLLKKKAAADDSGDGSSDAPHAAPASARHEPKTLPTFVPLEPFTVNLADHDTERYAQVGITLEVTDPQVAETIKGYMPAIRNNILMALAEKTAAQLMDREGKTRLAQQIRRETSRAMGYDVEEPDDETAAPADDGSATPPKKKKKKRKSDTELPIASVQFSNFIVQ